MAITIDGDDVEAPVSVYFGLEQGKVADLEAIAEAAIAWSSALKEMVGVLEPGITLKVQIVDGDQSSLWLNTLLTFIEGKFEQIARGAERFPRLMALARGLAIIVVATPLSVTSEDVWKALIKEQPDVVNLSPEAQKKLMDQFDKAIAGRLADKQADKFAAAVTKDASITGVGVAADSKNRPSLVVNRDRIAAHVGREKIVDASEETRRRTAIIEVTLVSPVLEDAERSWRFRQQGLPEFGAFMRDRQFLSAIGSRALHEEMRFGIPMTIEVEFKERFENGVWVPTERSVIQVISPEFKRSELPL